MLTIVRAVLNVWGFFVCLCLGVFFVELFCLVCLLGFGFFVGFWGFVRGWFVLFWFFPLLRYSGFFDVFLKADL